MGHSSVVFAVLFVSVFVISFSSNGQQVKPEELVYMTEQFKPENFEENGQLKGRSVEILEMVWKEMGATVNRNNIKVMTWARALNDLQNNKNTVLFAMGKSEERMKLFKFVGPYNTTVLSFIAKKDKKIKLTQLEDAKKYRIGTLREDVGDQILTSSGFDVNTLDRSAVPDAMLKKLQADRIDVICYTEGSAFQMMSSVGLKKDDYESIFTVKKFESCYAFNKDTPDELIQRFQTALDKLKKEGKIEPIVTKYDAY
ncbi:MAG: transporter substrate-binding domain-containing protein [Chitinivibrionales bacterium]|nr:transporter substrate-binding domain-containing protein [Chitinivibrionales bacterium]